MQSHLFLWFLLPTPPGQLIRSLPITFVQGSFGWLLKRKRNWISSRKGILESLTKTHFKRRIMAPHMSHYRERERKSSVSGTELIKLLSQSSQRLSGLSISPQLVVSGLNFKLNLNYWLSHNTQSSWQFDHVNLNLNCWLSRCLAKLSNLPECAGPSKPPTDTWDDWDKGERDIETISQKMWNQIKWCPSIRECHPSSATRRALSRLVCL